VGGLLVEPAEEMLAGPCPCCGDATRSLCGLIFKDDCAHAAYFVRWTPGRVPHHGAAFEIVLGAWGEGTGPADRLAVALELAPGEAGPGFRVVDAGPKEGLAERGLRRDEVVGTPIARDVFEIVDAVWRDDARIAELKNGS
jgi:hypothetical protein